MPAHKVVRKNPIMLFPIAVFSTKEHTVFVFKRNKLRPLYNVAYEDKVGKPKRRQ